MACLGSAAARGGEALAIRGATGTDDLQIVQRRIYETLIGGTGIDVGAVRQYAQRLRADGSWEDINYADQTRNGWLASVHNYRLGMLARAYRTPGHPMHGDPELKKKILAGLDYWFRTDPKNPNWWHNEIGQPAAMGNLLVLMNGELSAGQREAGLKILRRSRWERWTGQNLVWGATVQIVRGCIEKDPAVVAGAYERMYQEIRIAPAGHEGVQADYSFHQHGPLLYAGGYGHGFTVDCARFVWMARGTRFAAPAEKQRILESYVLDGQQWMTWGGRWDYEVTGRELTRPGKTAGGLAEAAERLATLGGARSAELTAFARRLRQEKGAGSLVGNRHFWRSDYMSHRREGWFASVRMFSTRLLNTDALTNSENKKSHHLADGANLLYREGEAYADIFPIWDWRRIPGTTIEQNTPLPENRVNYKGATDFAGGVSDGRYGMAAMHLKSGRMEARKFWAFFDDEYLCLGARIRCDSENPVFTSIEQCWSRGPAATSGGEVKDGVRTIAGRGWAEHAGTGYVFLDGVDVRVANQVQSGAWSEIGTGSSRTIRERVFSAWIDHHARPDNARYAYVVLPRVKPGETAQRAGQPGVRVLSNEPELQAAEHERLPLVFAAFIRPGRVQTRLGALEVDQPSLVMWERRSGGERLTVAHPEQREVAVVVTIRSAGIGGDAAPIRRRFDLPGGLLAGKSVTRAWTRENAAAPAQ